MVHTIEEALFCREYVSSIEETPEVVEILEFLKAHQMHTLLGDMYVLFNRMALDAFKRTGDESEEEFNKDIGRIIAEDGTMDKIHEIMCSA